jgi:hypothetical protein
VWRVLKKLRQPYKALCRPKHKQAAPSNSKQARADEAQAGPVGQLTVHDPAKKRASRQKGAAEERALVRFLQQRGFAAEKSSRAGYRGPDLTVPLLGIDRAVEVKVRAHAFGQIYSWLGNADLLIVRANRREPLCILPMWLASEIAAVAEGHQAHGRDAVHRTGAQGR